MNTIAIALVAGNFFTCALTQDHQVKCWGDSARHQLEVPVVTEPVTEIFSGAYHSCLRTPSQVKCWGNNLWNETDVPEHVQVKANSIATFARAAGAKATCVVYNDRTVDCWGDNRSGQITLNDSQSATPLRVTEISMGANHTCWVTTGDHRPQCIGQNKEGESSIPPELLTPMTRIYQLTTGSLHTCAIVSFDHTSTKVKCWGDNHFGQLELPTGLYDPSSLTAGAGHTCAVIPNSRPKCWGWDSYSQAQLPATLKAPTSFALGVAHSCAIQNGKVLCWGDNESHQLEVPAELKPE